jgi:uncharacterized protein (DUF2164 family)
MADKRADSPMRIRLSDERRVRMLESIKRHFADHFDEPVSDFRAQGLLDFFVRELGPPVYNQAIQDASAFVQEKLADLEGEIYEPETADRKSGT